MATTKSRRAPANEINGIKRRCEHLPNYWNWSLYRFNVGGCSTYQAAVCWGAVEAIGGGNTELQAWRALKVKLDDIARGLKSC